MSSSGIEHSLGHAVLGRPVAVDQREEQAKGHRPPIRGRAKAACSRAETREKGRSGSLRRPGGSLVARRRSGRRAARPGRRESPSQPSGYGANGPGRPMRCPKRSERAVLWDFRGAARGHVLMMKEWQNRIIVGQIPPVKRVRNWAKPLLASGRLRARISACNQIRGRVPCNMWNCHETSRVPDYTVYVVMRVLVYIARYDLLEDRPLYRKANGVALRGCIADSPQRGTREPPARLSRNVTIGSTATGSANVGKTYFYWFWRSPMRHGKSMRRIGDATFV